MNKLLIGAGTFVVVAIIIGLITASWLTGTYNSLVSQGINIDTEQAQIEAQLQRRFELIPNLVNSVKGFMGQERKVFEDIAEARTRYAGASAGTPEKVEAANTFESAFGRLLVIMENYPQLRSVETVQELMTQLEGTENRISVARQRYNEAVQKYNTNVKRFPSNIIAGWFGFAERKMFESVEGANVVPNVDLGI